ncbi:hypothetical protein [Bathymodiolus japonicus methanotrophic gill symbiont]|uniref:hypothetical protein n=1 Tax=Bathymodiolus japonicus methanotrophic gill symbiont TaxID=113269 RepID=UPI001C8E57CC|nr:hypothetical protein [Bathymodiolus japonicus methanotrophic gill symbiont]
MATGVPEFREVAWRAWSPLEYGEVEQGYRFGKGVRITNDGDADLTFTLEVTGNERYGFTDQTDQPGVGQRGGREILPFLPLLSIFTE